MITRMEITFKSKKKMTFNSEELKKTIPSILSPGSCRVKKDGMEFVFDFEETESGHRYEGDYLYVDCMYKNYDEDLDLPLKTTDPILRRVTKKDFLEVNYECYADVDENIPIELTPVDITFYDFSTSGDGKPITVQGDDFSNLEI